MAWYGTTPFPSETANRYASGHEYLVKEYKTDVVLPTTVSDSPLCHGTDPHAGNELPSKT